MTESRGTFRVHATRTRPVVEVSADGVGVVSHAGSRLLADLADTTTLTAQLSAVLADRMAPQTVHDPGRVLADIAVMIADGGQCLSDIATLVDQPGVFGPVASDTTCRRVLESMTDADLCAVAQARAAAREVAWAQRGEQTGAVLPASLVCGRPLLSRDGRAVLVIDEDATLVIAHSEKEQARPTFKHTFGFHPVLAFCDNTNEALTGMLRAGNAGSNTAADHIEVIDAALAQVPAEYRHGYPILLRFDGAGASKALLAHLRGLREDGVDAEFSVGWALGAREHAAIAALPESAWTAAIDVDGDPREGAGVVELTGMFPAAALADYPAGLRVIARRERPHPGAQLDLIEERDGWRYTCFATDTQHGQHAWLDARHRSHARVEDRIRCGKDTGLGRFPSKVFAINKAWLACALVAIDLIAWAQTTLLHDQPALAKAEPKTLRYRLLHVAARLVRGGRRLRLKIDKTWRWAHELATAFARLRALPTPLT
ncbi:MAG: IS1380 family transposase [Jatrophihabitans sp.]|nr:MAG: IS1380 family transposase [Jatrophihabitans sp.]